MMETVGTSVAAEKGAFTAAGSAVLVVVLLQVSTCVMDCCRWIHVIGALSG
jgi:hypothetical protein